MSRFRSGSTAADVNDGRTKDGSAWKHYVMMAEGGHNDMNNRQDQSYPQHGNLNKLSSPEEGHMFDGPIIGFVFGAYPIFSEFKRVARPFHSTPREVIIEEAELNNVPPPEPEDIRVIAYALPFTTRTRWDSSATMSAPSNRWVYIRVHGEKLKQEPAGLRRGIIKATGVPSSGPGTILFYTGSSGQAGRCRLHMVSSSYSLRRGPGFIRFIRELQN